MKILVVEDDKDLSLSLKECLESKDHRVEVALDGGEGSFLAKNYQYDAIVLDYSLPKKSGIEVCKEIRSQGKSTPIVFLSATENTDTKISALEYGADDYITKPFSFEELHARLRALNRRPAIKEQTILTIGNLVLNRDTCIVTIGGKHIYLTKKEFSVLEYLMRHPGTIVSRILIMEHVWTADTDILSNAVESHIRNLRRKLRDNGIPEPIINIPGRGYMMPA